MHIMIPTSQNHIVIYTGWLMFFPPPHLPCLTQSREQTTAARSQWSTSLIFTSLTKCNLEPKSCNTQGVQTEISRKTVTSSAFRNDHLAAGMNLDAGASRACFFHGTAGKSPEPVWKTFGYGSKAWLLGWYPKS